MAESRVVIAALSAITAERKAIASTLGDDAFGDVPANHVAVNAMADRWYPRR